MTETAESATFPALSRAERYLALLGIVIVGVVQMTFVVRVVLVPDDPYGAVSVQVCRLGWWIIPICAALAFVLSALACWVSHGKLDELGVFAVALGLAMAALQYADAGYLWFRFGQGLDPARRSLGVSMTFEACGWFLVVIAAYAGSKWVIGRFSLRPKVPTDPMEEYRRGALTVLFIVLVAMLLLQILSAGTQLAPIDAGQAYFACAVSFYAAAWISYQLTAAHSPAWGCLAVLVVAVLGYAWTAMSATPSFPGRDDIAVLRHFPPTVYGRALPIQLIMVGTAAAIFGNWHQRQVTRYSVQQDQSKSAA